MVANIGVFGANGRMGRNLVQTAIEDENSCLSAAVVRANNEVIGIDAGVLVGSKPANTSISTLDEVTPSTTDVWIDFTLPIGLEQHLAFCLKHRKNLVVGVTGLSAEQEAKLIEASKKIAIVYAANFSTGVNLLYKLLEITSKTIGDDCDIEIIESHHRMKKDAPSGTALALGKVIASTLERDLDEVAVYGREGETGERDRQTIGFATVRAGDIVGEHTALFADIGERIEISHKASNRSIYAKGAVRAAKWLVDKENGLFDMQDVLGLRKVNV